MQKLLLSVIVFISGFTILSFEIVGSRMLAPIVGTTAPVWGALLAVIIAGSALGSYIGGAQSDTNIASSKYVMSTYALAAAWITLSIPIKNIFLTIRPVSHYGLIALLCGLGLFFVPTVLLSSTTTFLIKRSAHDIKNIGTNAGSLYAIATIGSVVGIFGTSYILIPRLSIPFIFYTLTSITVFGGLCGSKIKMYARQKTNL